MTLSSATILQTSIQEPLQEAPLSRWFKLKETLALTLLTLIPRKPGIVLRQLVYPSLLRRMGQQVGIEWGVEFAGIQRVELGEGTWIGQCVSIDASGANSLFQINGSCLKSQVQLIGWNEGSNITLNGVTAYSGVELACLPHGSIDIQEGTYLGAYSCISGGKVKIGKDCLIAAHCGIYAHNHNFSHPTIPIRHQGFSEKGIVIEDNCWLGHGAIVLDGVTIGRGSVIGAGSVVTKDIPPMSVAVGVPAKVVSQRTEEEVALHQVEQECDRATTEVSLTPL